MVKKVIRTGTTADPTGDSLKNAFVKVNDNFTELYNALGLDADLLNLGAFEFTGSTMTTTDSSAIVIDQATTITSNLSVGGDVLPSVANGGDLGSSTLPWRSLYVSNNTIYIGGTAVGLDANGNLTTGGTVVGSTPAWANITGKPTIPTSFSSLVNGAKTVSLDANGNLTFPQGTLLGYSDPGGFIINGAVDKDIAIYTYNGADAHGWTFGTDGSLTLPGDIRSEGAINIDINLSDSTLRRWRFGEDGDTVFPNNVSINYSGNNVQFPRIIADSGKAFSIQGQGNSGSAALAWSVDPDAASQYAAVSVSRAGGDNLAKVVLQAQSDSGDAATAKTWKFDENGALTLPGGSTIAEVGPFGVLQITPTGGANAYQALMIYPWATAEGDQIHLASGDPATVDLYLGDNDQYVKIEKNGGDVVIGTNTNTKQWTFGTDGGLTFPDSTVQSTAWTGFSVAADDSTQRSISSGELVKFIGAGTVTTASDAEGNITITGSGGSLGNIFAVYNNTLVSSDSDAYINFDADNGNNILALGTNDGAIVTISTDGGYSTFEFVADTGSGSIKFPDGTIQTTAAQAFSFSVAADDSTQRSISSGELVKFIGAGGVTTASDAEGNITITGSGGGSSIPTVVTTGAVGVDGAAHAKVQFTVTSATTVTAVGVTAIGVTDSTKGTITLSGSPATGAFDIVAVTNTYPGEFYIFIPFATNASGTGYGAPISGEGTNPCLVRGTMITMADMSRVAVENITYHDDILVWDFDLGEFASAKPLWIKKTQTTVVSCLLTFSDHSELQIVGDSPKAHRIFNKEAGKFTYGSMPETPIGTTTFNDQGEEITLISKEWIVGEVEFYNVMTDYHMNLFANSILTSMRYNNLYPITDMKFVKDSRTLRTADDYPNVEERLYKGFRLAEQTQSIEEIETHIQWLMTLEVERETECV